MILLAIKRRWLAPLVLTLVAALVLGGIWWGQSRAATAELQDSVELPIIMYHSILKDPKLAGTYVLSPQMLESDLQYLQKHGFTTVFMADVIAYVYDGTPLPAKPVVLTFDDGYLNNLVYVLPLLEQYDMKAVISVIGSYTDKFSQTSDPNPSYAHLTWDDLKTLAASGHVEIQSHSYNMHSNQGRPGAARKVGESLSNYEHAFLADARQMEEALKAKAGLQSNTYTYPFGQVSEESTAILQQMGIKASLSCYEKVNRLTREPQNLYNLGRFNRPSGPSSAEFFQKVLSMGQDPA